MRIVVCVKQVVDTEAEKKLVAPEWRIDRTVENILNPYDEYAVEAAIQLKEASDAEVIALCIGPDEAEDAVRKALAMGADEAVLVTDDALAGSDALGTAMALAAVIKPLEADLVLCGAMSTDAQTGLVAPALGEFLGLPVFTGVSHLEIDGGAITVHRQTDEGYVAYGGPLPAVVAVAKGMNEPRYPSIKGIMGAKKKPMETRSAADLGIDAATVGAAGAKTRVLGSTTVPPRAAGERLSDYASPEEAAGKLADFLAANKLI
jgi:electron transfer flavoprotein beta subunit